VTIVTARQLYAIGRPNATSADMVASGLRGRKLFPTVSLAACGLMLSVLANGCGEATRDAHEPKGTYAVEIVKARFPAKQAIARDSKLELVVRNSGNHSIPNVAITLDSLNYRSNYPKLSAAQRPTWIVNTGPGASPKLSVQTEEAYPPGGGETAFVNTWALGVLAPKASETFVWRVTPVKAGVHTVHYAVAAGLDGNARATLKGGGHPVGKFVVSVAGAPPRTHVDLETGRVLPGPPPVPATPQPASP
jgi:hypothetical protein